MAQWQQKKRNSHQITFSTTMFSVALLLLLAAGPCLKCEQLTQPASVTVQPGQHLTISCQVSYDLNSYWSGWIRQPAGKGLEWIGLKRGGGSHYKDSLKNKLSINADSASKTVTLNGQNMQPEDSAVYYCARYPQTYKQAAELHKKP
ncbi:hypothetical protein CRENBAI_011561 [Crenichthys baileyi]|uniref:Ig-like domain-containing protein n=1 Tax=Crenichthys baileyi TaxID=28760 RepID=A0AAV9RUK1_9TELE